jgi:hypothetical protein
MTLEPNYFESYDNISVHNLMLRDEVRVQKYKEAILNSKNLFKDKVYTILFSLLIIFYFKLIYFRLYLMLALVVEYYHYFVLKLVPNMYTQ